MGLDQIKHEPWHNQWHVKVPMVVGTRGAVDIEVLDFPKPKQLAEMAFEAWERMTDGGINGENAEEYSTWFWNVGRKITYKMWILNVAR